MRKFFCLLLLAASATAQTVSPEVRDFVKVDAPVVALTHVRVIDGTGAPAHDNQTVVITEGKIQAVGADVRRLPLAERYGAGTAEARCGGRGSAEDVPHVDRAPRRGDFDPASV
jgi:hypothetical protein